MAEYRFQMSERKKTDSNLYRSRPIVGDHGHERNFTDSSQLSDLFAPSHITERTRKKDSFTYDIMRRRSRTARSYYDVQKGQQTERLNFGNHFQFVT